MGVWLGEEGFFKIGAISSGNESKRLFGTGKWLSCVLSNNCVSRGVEVQGLSYTWL